MTQAQYEDLFKSCTNKVRGDFSPSYANKTEYIERIYRYVPNAKIILLLRNPIDALYSGYLHEKRSGNRLPPFVAWAEEQYPASDYKYDRILTDLEPFQVHVDFYERAVSDTRAFLSDLYTFLGVDIGFESASMNELHNVR
ncbi:MAG: hypothetical protein HOI95_00795 [Chromatiales bacterium]|jgi:hypothetical protein|nr:hypothetical protein [Chromatiales bacterium]